MLHFSEQPMPQDRLPQRRMLRKPAEHEHRTPEQIRQHYEVEKELADRLRCAPPEQRSQLYPVVYDELLRRVPTHPNLTRNKDPLLVGRLVAEKMALLSGLIAPDVVFMEVGAGDCRLALEVARRVKKVYAVDVCAEISAGMAVPSNFELLLTNGTEIPLAPNTITVAYSYQLMEHIHPGDALEELHNIYRALAPGGMYVCITPNRLFGPHDVSKYFDRTASGFHLKEYTLSELKPLFQAAGFQRVAAYAGTRGRFAQVPLPAVTLLENIVSAFPWRLRRHAAELPLLRHLLSAAVIGWKPLPK